MSKKSLNYLKNQLKKKQMAKDYADVICDSIAATNLVEKIDILEHLVRMVEDALEKPMQKPLTLEEAINSEWTVWVEINGWTKPRAGDVWASKRLEGYAMFAFIGESPRSHAAMNRYGKGWRCWASRPTDEERSAAAWES